MFFDLLNIKTPAWYQTFIDGRRLTSAYTFIRVSHPAHKFCEVYRKSRDSPEEQEEPDNTDKPVPFQTLKLTDQYLALLVIILTNAGLCQVRYTINENIGESHSDSRHLPPCLKNHRWGRICPVKPLYLWPKCLH